MSKLLQVREENKRYFSEDYIKGFNDGAKKQYEEDIKRGHWEYVKENPFVLSYLKCSCCGRASNSYEKYCSNCGARMEADNGLV